MEVGTAVPFITISTAGGGSVGVAAGVTVAGAGVTSMGEAPQPMSSRSKKIVAESEKRRSVKEMGIE